MDETEQLAGFVFEMGLLKRYKRTGWLVAGVADPESIADHSFRAAVLASVLAALEGADPERAALLSLFHDSQETRLTDLPYLAKPYVTKASNEHVTAHQMQGLPDVVARLITGAVDEYEGKESLEAVCARDADKLECLIQAIEYGDQGNRNIKPWIESSLAQLRTESAKRLAHQAMETGTLDWAFRALSDDSTES
ncbi:HD domain-containing protein [Actinomadura rupiterrae]|uniref:HD domain-containing protein n=1 Tax=Actinomadura rupiterrae TaxID=559627 RepID=UPI0020A4CB7D|nr:HD domain-containing protein [Actinomadura rupiterrae]MCP2334899.1 putative hydrolase of HD superfamily [Actinomadura rupiterrae]